MSIILFNYEGSPIQFEEINGQIMANATLMSKAFNKEPNDIFKTKSWKEYEEELLIDSNLRSEDIRSVKNGDNGGSWIHQELVIEFARRLKPAFSVWCNRKISELLRTGKTEIKKELSPAEALLQQVQLLVDQERKINEIKEDIKLIKAHQVTSPNDFFAVAGFASLNNIKIDTSTANIIGRKASRNCKELGYTIGKVTDPRFGSVNTYPIEVLEEAFKELKLLKS